MKKGFLEKAILSETNIFVTFYASLKFLRLAHSIKYLLYIWMFFSLSCPSSWISYTQNYLSMNIIPFCWQSESPTSPNFFSLISNQNVVTTPILVSVNSCGNVNSSLLPPTHMCSRTFYVYHHKISISLSICANHVSRARILFIYSQQLWKDLLLNT